MRLCSRRVLVPPLEQLSWHPTVQAARLIGDIEAGWQAKSAELMGPAIQAAKARHRPSN
jgi:hypothetical protein